MRRLIPDNTGATDVLSAYRPPPPKPSPFVRVNMIASVDGAVEVGGKSGPLGGRADRHVFNVLRGLADVIVVGAGTFRREGYGPVRLEGRVEDQRLARGQAPVPPIAVVTRSCWFDWSAPFFTEAATRPIIVTTARACGAAPAAARAAADLMPAGDPHEEAVSVARAVAALGDRGFGNILVEGGPSLVGQLAAAGLIDELCLTLSPQIVGGAGSSLLGDLTLPSPIKLRTIGVLEEDGYYFLRFAAAPSGARERDDAS